jgi:hypothetical protein
MAFVSSNSSFYVDSAFGRFNRFKLQLIVERKVESQLLEVRAKSGSEKGWEEC